ncbi:UDP-glucose 4-epimerase GalE [Caenibacillus caldisaponilyticus]|uniref:UDP-glucose 4-epimerase GalE n=1 Tax=Caenibacillus caldisaponilyticus TaxID=1674942 RepID=UPI0009888CF2|nr:UDP-glucose 4-epimerase GalE [Caenibacillus caldisaponilyticus]
MSILVTGGAGYIGSHTCVELLDAGYDIVVIDNFANSKPAALERVREITGKTFPYYHVDLLDREALEKVFADHEIEAVIHFAGLKAVGESVEQPLRYYHNNVTGSVILFDVMQKHGVKKCVFSSSATVYGKQDVVQYTEDLPLGPINPYGRTKRMIEDILRDVHASDPEWGVALLRYFNPVGAHESGRIGEDPNGIPNNLMPFITQVAVGKREELKVFGNDYPTRDGTGVRDYIHVVDLAKGHVLALKKVLASRGVEAYNLGTGRGYSVLEIVHAFEKATGQKIPYSIVGRRPGDLPEYFADPSKAKAELGWSAEKTLEDMCADAWRWQVNNPNGYE